MLYECGREVELEPGYLMGWSVNNLNIGGSLESILERIFEIPNANGEVVGGNNGNNQIECRC